MTSPIETIAGRVLAESWYGVHDGLAGRAVADHRGDRVIAREDDRRGHFVLTVENTYAIRDGHAHGDVTGVDLGNGLHLTSTGAILTPAEARELAEALTWWADKRTETKPVETESLLDLLEGSA